MISKAPDLLAFGGEDIKLREHLEWTLFYEWAEPFEEVQRAVALCACGFGEEPVILGGSVMSAIEAVVLHDLAEFVKDRRAGLFGLN